MAHLRETGRKIHLDFHTPHWVRKVGQDYDPERLVRIWKEARINAATVVFGLCACGNAYYETKDGPMHPGLEGRDLLTPLLSAATREGIAIYVHFSMGINDRIVIERPDWAMRRRDGSRLDTDGGREWGWPCFNSPFAAERLWPQLEDFVPRYPDVAGIFIDMVMYPEETCRCEFCLREAVRRGVDTNDQDSMDAFYRDTLDAFAEKTRAIVRRHNPNMAFTCNNHNYIGGARSPHLDFLELEAPVSWNSFYFPLMSRYMRNLGKPVCGMTTRFPKNWGYFGSLNNEVQLQFEAATIMATLGGCCVGDQLHPSGRPDEGVYELIGSVYRRVEQCEPWTLEAESVPYIALLADNQRNLSALSASPGYYNPNQSSGSLFGAGLALLESNRHFDVLDERSPLAEYRLIWLAENVTLNPALAPEVEAYVRSGGRLIVTGGALWKQPAWRDALERMAGVRYAGESRTEGEYIRPLPGFSARLPDAPYFVKGRIPVFELVAPDAEVIAKALHPYEGIGPERRFGHFHAPAGEEAGYPGGVMRACGAGRIAAIGASLAADYFAIGSRHTRQFVANVLDALLPERERLVEVAPHTHAVEISLMRRPGQWILHLVQFSAKRYTENTVVEEVPVRRNIPIVLRPPAKPHRLYAAPSGEPLDWEWEEDAGALRVVLPELHIHAMVVAEFAQRG